MSNHDELPDDIDWNEVRLAQIRVTELVWGHFAALQASGFNEHMALELTLAYQQHLLHMTQPV